MALAANTPVDCTYTCDDGVTKVLASTQIDLGQGAEDVALASATTVTSSTANANTACVTLSDALFAALEPGSWRWVEPAEAEGG